MTSSIAFYFDKYLALIHECWQHGNERMRLSRQTFITQP